MIKLKKYNFTEEDDEWYFEEYIDIVAEFKQSNYNMTGYLSFQLETEDDENNNFKKPQVFQENALNYFLDNQKSILKKLSRNIASYIDVDIQENNNELDYYDYVKKNASIESLNILGSQKENYSYTVFIFDIEDEHGLGIITHKDRIIDVTDADTALYDWNDKIKQDRLTKEEWKQYLEEREKRDTENIANSINQDNETFQKELDSIQKSKKWWQFWK